MDSQDWPLLPVEPTAVIERAPTGLGVIAADGLYIMVNPAFAELLARPRDEVLGTSAVSYLHPDDRAAGQADLDRLLRGEIDHGAADLRYVRADGVVVWARIVTSSLPGPDGRVAGVVVQTKDITAEREAAQAAAEMHSLVAVLDEAVITLDGEGRVRTWNAAAERLLGWPADEMTGRPVTALIPPGRDLEREPLTRFGRGESVHAETACLRRDESSLIVEITATSIRDEASVLLASIGVLHDIAEQKRAAQRLEHLARHDPLTGLPNRREFGERLQAALSRSRDSRDLVGLVFLDLDRFKEVNDRHGHPVGDEYLRVVGARLHGAIRPVDTLARWGGDEYAVLVERAHAPGEVTAVAERLLGTLRRPVHIRAFDLPAAASIGVATSAPGYTDPDDLLQAADLAMYEAKRRGGNRWVLSG